MPFLASEAVGGVGIVSFRAIGQYLARVHPGEDLVLEISDSMWTYWLWDHEQGEHRYFDWGDFHEIFDRNGDDVRQWILLLKRVRATEEAIDPEAWVEAQKIRSEQHERYQTAVGR